MATRRIFGKGVLLEQVVVEQQLVVLAQVAEHLLLGVEDSFPELVPPPLDHHGEDFLAGDGVLGDLLMGGRVCDG